MSNAEQTEHTTVLLHEAVDALVTDPMVFMLMAPSVAAGIRQSYWSDCLIRVRCWRLIKTLRLLRSGQERFADDGRLTVVHGSFADLKNVAAEWVRPVRFGRAA